LVNCLQMVQRELNMHHAKGIVHKPDLNFINLKRKEFHHNPTQIGFAVKECNADKLRSNPRIARRQNCMK
jgi:hypothetical protein